MRMGHWLSSFVILRQENWLDMPMSSSNVDTGMCCSDRHPTLCNNDPRHSSLACTHTDLQGISLHS